jgi:hypothetical protein
MFEKLVMDIVGTLDHLVRFETFIRNAFAKKEHAVSIFFDLEKAYDTTWASIDHPFHGFTHATS